MGLTSEELKKNLLSIERFRALEGSIRFGMVEDFGTTLLPFILSRLRREHPPFELSIETGLGIDLNQRLEAGSFDLILTKRVAGPDNATSPVLAESGLG